MTNDLSPEQQRLAEEIAAEAERQLAEIYTSPESEEAVARSGIDDRPPEVALSKQFAIVKEFFQRDVEDVLHEIVPKLGICSEDHPIYRTFEEFDKLAKAPLAGYLMGLAGIAFPATGAPTMIAAIVVIIAFYGLDEFCDRYCPDR